LQCRRRHGVSLRCGPSSGAFYSAIEPLLSRRHRSWRRRSMAESRARHGRSNMLSGAP
jgi:hypothetical protein